MRSGRPRASGWTGAWTASGSTCSTPGTRTPTCPTIPGGPGCGRSADGSSSTRSTSPGCTRRSPSSARCSTRTPAASRSASRCSRTPSVRPRTAVDRGLHAAFDFEFRAGAGGAREHSRPAIERWLRAQRRRRLALLGARQPRPAPARHPARRRATPTSGHGWPRRSCSPSAARRSSITARKSALPDVRLRRDQILDPPGRRFWPFYRGRDGCRAPMPWNAGPNGGFTTGTPWLPLHPGFPRRNVEVQRARPAVGVVVLP